jgi:hypothetical protein
MALRRGLVPAIAIAIAAMTDAFAQFAPQVAKPPCWDDFMPLREEAQKRATAISVAGKRKAEPNEICALLGRFAEAEAKVIQFVETNGQWCGIPPEMLKQMKESQSKAAELRERTCGAKSPPPKRMRIAAFSPDFAGW